MTVDPAEFANRVAEVLGPLPDQTIERRGEARGVRTRLGGRVVEAWTNGTTYWLKADVRLSSFPDDFAVVWAPEGSYVRQKLREEGSPTTPTGDGSFDRAYLVFGATEEDIDRRINARARTALLDNASLQVDLQAVEVRTQVHKRLHLHARADRAGWTPEGAVAAVHKLVDLAVRLEAVWDNA